MKDCDALQLILSILHLSNGAYTPEEISELIELIKYYDEEFTNEAKTAVLHLVEPKPKEH